MAEFDLLRAQVARDNQRPEVIRVRNARDLAYLRLKQLLDLPLDQPMQLVSTLEEPVLPPPAARLAAAIAAAEAGTDGARARTAVTQAGNDVQQREAGDPHRAGAAAAVGQRELGVRPRRLSAVSRVRRFPHQLDRRRGRAGADLHRRPAQGGRADGARGSRREPGAAAADAGAGDARRGVDPARARQRPRRLGVDGGHRPAGAAGLRDRRAALSRGAVDAARAVGCAAAAAAGAGQRAQAARDVQLARVRLALLPDLPLSAASAATAAASRARRDGRSRPRRRRRPPRPHPRRQRAQDRNENDTRAGITRDAIRGPGIHDSRSRPPEAGATMVHRWLPLAGRLRAASRDGDRRTLRDAPGCDRRAARGPPPAAPAAPVAVQVGAENVVRGHDAGHQHRAADLRHADGREGRDRARRGRADRSCR